MPANNLHNFLSFFSYCSVVAQLPKIFRYREPCYYLKNLNMEFLGVLSYVEYFRNDVTVLLNSDAVEHIVFMRNAGLYGILFLKNLGSFDCACKYIYWSAGLQKVVF